MINRGSKIRVKPFTAKVLSACENEKITVYAEETIFTNRISRERNFKYSSLQQLKSSFGGTFGTRGK